MVKERRNSLYALLVLAGSFAGGVVGSYLWSGQSIAMADAAARATKVVKAQKFILVGPKGEERALIDVASTGTAFFALYDLQGMDRADLRVDQDGGASLAFYDEGGKRKLVAGASASGKAGLGIFGNSGKQLAGLSAA